MYIKIKSKRNKKQNKMVVIGTDNFFEIWEKLHK